MDTETIDFQFETDEKDHNVTDENTKEFQFPETDFSGLETPAVVYEPIPETKPQDNLETETFWVEGFSQPFNLAGLRKKVQEYAIKHFNGTGRETTNIYNGKIFYRKYISRATVEQVKELNNYLQKQYPAFSVKIRSND